MRSILFFLVVFSCLMAVLYFFVEKDGRPAPEMLDDFEPLAESAESMANTVDLPFYNTKLGRLEYRLRGELDDRHLQELSKIGDLTDGVLHRGEIEIPIYEDMAENLPGSANKRPKEFRLAFENAEYHLRYDDFGQERQEIHLSGGGTGTSDDGTVIRFEEISIDIREVDRKKVFHIRSDKRISISNDILTIESPSGMEGEFKEDRKLENVRFEPPVIAYVSPTSARLFKVPGAKSNGSEGEEDEKDRGLVAITSVGGLLFERAPEKDSARQRILFRDDVRIFPVEAATPGATPEPTDTWFHCQELEIVIDKTSESTRPSIREARATWPDGRVRAVREGLVAEGASLVWELTEGEQDRSPASRARLTGRPTFTDRGFETICDEAIFQLDTDVVELVGDVQGHFEFDISSTSPAAEKTQVTSANGESGKTADARESVANVTAGKKSANMEFLASRARIHFERDQSPAKSSKSTGIEKADKALASIRRFEAFADTDNGLILSSSDTEEPFVLRARNLIYDSREERVSLEGGKAQLPHFELGKTRGEARRIELRLRDRLLRLVEAVKVDLQVRRYDSGEIANARVVPASNPPAPPTRNVENNDTDGTEKNRMVRLEAREMEVAFDFDAQKILWAEARSRQGEPVVLVPISSGDPKKTSGNNPEEEFYRIEGPALRWDHALQVATIEAPTGDDGAVFPSLQFEKGELRARKILFNRGKWTSTLEGGVEIQTHEGKASSKADKSAQSRSKLPPIQFTCHRAEVEFHEGFRAAQRGPDEFLSSVRAIHAWRSESEPMTIKGRDFTATSNEALWSSGTRELRLFGGGQQEFRRREGEREDLLRADEIVFLRPEGLIKLRRNVSGQIRQPEARSQDVVVPRANANVKSKSTPLEWQFQTNMLDVYVRESKPSGELLLDRLYAAEEVHLKCEQKGLELHGDDLEYHSERQELRIFSTDDRFQTLKRTRGHLGSGSEGQVRVLTDEIHAREIRLHYLRAVSPPGDGRETSVQVRLQFRDSVNAKFHHAASGSGFSLQQPAKNQKLIQVWKFRSDLLTLKIFPRRVGRGELQHGFAEGNVDITSDDFRAMAQQATYDEKQKKLALSGDEKNKVYLKQGDKVTDRYRYVEVRKLGTQNRLHFKRN